jgi:protein-tyrosine phosphatase
MKPKKSKRVPRRLYPEMPKKPAEVDRRDMAPRTSVTSPLYIDAVNIKDGHGVIGMTLCPGKQGPSHFKGPWQRDLVADMEVLQAWGCQALLSLMEDQEFERFQVTRLGEVATAVGIKWYHIPISDGEPPDERFDRLWPSVGQALVANLLADKRIVVHCRGGLGRTGVIACLLLIELGYSSKRALTLIRTIRPGTVQTAAQVAYVLGYTPRLN